MANKYKLPQAVIDEIMASTTSLAEGIKLIAKEYRVLEDSRKSQAESRAETTPPEVAHDGYPCTLCGNTYIHWNMCPARVSELVRIVSELEKTADGVPITPKTELWQAHPQRGLNKHLVHVPWQCGPGWSFKRHNDLPVYSTEEAAREAELETENE